MNQGRSLLSNRREVKKREIIIEKPKRSNEKLFVNLVQANTQSNTHKSENMPELIISKPKKER